MIDICGAVHCLFSIDCVITLPGQMLYIMCRSVNNDTFDANKLYVLKFNNRTLSGSYVLIEIIPIKIVKHINEHCLMHNLNKNGCGYNYFCTIYDYEFLQIIMYYVKYKTFKCTNMLHKI